MSVSTNFPGKVTREQIIAALGYEPVGGQGVNLARGTSREWSDWITPKTNKDNVNDTVNIETHLLDNKKAGDLYTCSLEMEFKDVKAIDGQAFRIMSQGMVDTKWESKNIWYELVLFTTPPENKVYRFVRTVALDSAVVTATKFMFGFRINYWGAGQFRYRRIKAEAGAVSNPIWTPAPEDYIALEARVKALEGK